jgi:opacity protein-like surface antigen
VTYFPEIIDNTGNALAKSHVLTLSESFLFGPILDRVRPYGAIGIGDLYLNATSTSIGSVSVESIAERISNNYLTIGMGGGVMYFFNTRVGARADLRYFRAFGWDISDESGLKINRFDFWRAGFGAAFKF